MMKFIRGLFALILLMGLTACGGGGGSPGNTSGGTKLFTSAAEKITIAPGVTQTFSIGGGVPNYSATSSTGAAIVTVVDKTLTITGGGGGTATVTVRDASGGLVSIAVTVGSGIDLFTSAPGTVVVGVGGQSAEYTIGGGSLIYNVSTSNSAIADVVYSGNRFVIVGVLGGTAQITVRDTIGGVVLISVTVGSVDALFTTANSDINVGVNAAATYNIGGGKGPYTVGSSSVAVASASISGSKLTITGLSVGKSTVIIRDASTGLVTITVTVGSGADLFTSAPADLSVGVGSSSPTFTIGGGSQIYTVASGNTQVATVGINDNKFTVNGVAAGVTTVTVKDTLGKTVTINLTVGSAVKFYTTAPSAITLTASGTGTYVVGGGVAPYTATSSNTAVATASISGNTLTLKGIISGQANVILRDSAGTTIPLTVTLGSGAANAVFTTAPAAVTIAVGSSPSYQIGGGSGPYSIASSNTTIASVNLNADNTFTITGVATGNASVVVKDSAGIPVTIAVNVGSGAAVGLYTTAPSTINLAPGSAPVYSIGGGTAPYAATSSDVKVVTVVVVGNAMTVTAVGPGTATIRLVDSVGTPISITVNVISGTNSDLSVAPTTVSAVPGDTIYIRIDGGSAPYNAVSSNNSVASITGGSVLNAPGVVSAFMSTIGTATIVVTDAKGKVITVAIAVAAGGPGMFLTPTTWTIDETNNSSISLSISGGNPPFQVFTNNTLLSSVVGANIDPANPLTFTGRTVTVSLGTQGTRCVAANTPVTITVKDVVNTSTTSVMTVRDTNGAAGC
ncbi:beta strand repeat-containing protein [Undibacterium sp. JH2W]|uniref:beta strand repeat-containing protein n=1 Tax=Undibacterium sp. JH2W TaxID=3413037 RepID=UPI003BF10D85